MSECIENLNSPFTLLLFGSCQLVVFPSKSHLLNATWSSSAESRFFFLHGAVVDGLIKHKKFKILHSLIDIF